MKVSFDFDNTITSIKWTDDYGFCFGGFNLDTINKMRMHISNNDDVCILTSRSKVAENKRKYYEVDPDSHTVIDISIQYFFDNFGINVPILFADSKSKKEHIVDNNISLHYEDDVIEVNDIGNACVCVLLEY
jgi:hypothetical protein